MNKILSLLLLGFVYAAAPVFACDNKADITIMRVQKHHNIKEIADVINQAFKKMPFLKDERVTLQELEKIIEDTNKRLYVCVDGKRICGTIALDVSGENVEMQLFAIHPDYQGKNIGSLLMQHVEQ